MRWWVAEHDRNTSTNTNEITSTDENIQIKLEQFLVQVVANEVYEVHLRLGVLV